MIVSKGDRKNPEMTGESLGSIILFWVLDKIWAHMLRPLLRYLALAILRALQQVNEKNRYCPKFCERT